MKTVLIAIALFITGGLAVADSTPPFWGTLNGTEQTATGFLVSLPKGYDTAYGVFARTDVIPEFHLYSAEFKPKISTDELLGKYCKVTGRLIGKQHGTARLEISHIELAEPSAPANGASPRR